MERTPTTQQPWDEHAVQVGVGGVQRYKQRPLDVDASP